MSTISNGESGASVRTKLNASLVITDAISDTASGVIISDTERTKLGTIEGGADVTDSINVASSGALMDADFSQSTGSLFKDGPGVYHAIKSNLTASIDPTVNDDVSADYEPFSFWINTSTTPRKIFICTDSTDGAAVWKVVGSTELIDDLTPQLGGNLDLNSKTIGSATSDDLTKLNSLTATALELNYIDGVTSSIQNQIDGKQEALINQTNIKSVNGVTLLGSGDLTVSSSAAWGGITGTLSSQTDLQSALDLKQDDITLTTTGTSGVATFVGSTLNVPDYGSAASSVAWGDITGTLSTQTDLQTALDLKADLTGATFTGAVSATNLSGTNTGDQDISGIATNTTAISTKLSTTGGAMTGAITTNSTFDGRDVAADGVTADAALPKTGGAMTGAITTNSTFDGRDVAADGVTADAALPKTGGAMTGAITGNVAITGFRPYLRETTTARTLSLSDAGTFISAENVGGTEVTIPTNASVAFTQGTEIDFIQKTAGVLSITGDTGVTLNGASGGSVEVTAQWGGVTIKLIATNEWIAVGKI